MGEEREERPGVDYAASARERDGVLPRARVAVFEIARDRANAGDVRVKKDGTNAAIGSNQVTREDYSTAFTALGALDPIYDPEMLGLLFEHSNSLRQNVDAYATNIHAFGHRFDATINLDDNESNMRIADALRIELERAGEEVPEQIDENLIADTKKKIVAEMRNEKAKLKFFFDYCCPETSFVSLRRKTCQDYEVTGNAYWEILRNRGGEVSQFVYVPAFTIRLLPLDIDPTAIDISVRRSELGYESVPMLKRFRRFVQIVEGRSVFFKEFGDPRLVSANTGAVYPNMDAMRAADPKDVPATEILHFCLHSSRSSYGVPRWIGNLLAVIGSRQAEEVNFNYFENKSVPPLAILVSGGRVSAESVERVKSFIEAEIKGKRNFHKILILDAEAGGDNTAAGSSRMKIDVKPLTGAQHNDALFQNYDERNIDKVGQSFRLPRMLRGDIRDFNRSTADAALTFAEVQVFEPERQEFDFIINRKILSVLGIKFWEFTSLAPVIRDAVAMSEIIRNLANANVLTPEEGRELAGDVFNREFKRINADWTKQPGAFTVAGIPVQPEKPSVLDPNDASDGDPNFGTEGGDIAPNKPPGEGITGRSKRVEKKAKEFRDALLKEAGRLILLKRAIDVTSERAWLEHMLEVARRGETDSAAE